MSAPIKFNTDPGVNAIDASPRKPSSEDDEDSDDMVGSKQAILQKLANIEK